MNLNFNWHQICYISIYTIIYLPPGISILVPWRPTRVKGGMYGCWGCFCFCLAFSSSTRFSSSFSSVVIRAPCRGTKASGDVAGFGGTVYCIWIWLNNRVQSLFLTLSFRVVAFFFWDCGGWGTMDKWTGVLMGRYPSSQSLKWCWCGSWRC